MTETTVQTRIKLVKCCNRCGVRTEKEIEVTEEQLTEYYQDADNEIFYLDIDPECSMTFSRVDYLCEGCAHREFYELTV